MPKAKPEHPSMSAMKIANAALRKEIADVRQTNENLRRALLSMLETLERLTGETRATIFPNWNGDK